MTQSKIKAAPDLTIGMCRRLLDYVLHTRQKKTTMKEAKNNQNLVFPKKRQVLIFFNFIFILFFDSAVIRVQGASLGNNN